MPEHEIDGGLIIKPQVVEQPSDKIYRIGLVMPVLNYFEGGIDVIASVRSKHIVSTYIMPQYRQKEALSKAWNMGINRAFSEGCDFALVCNDDIIFSPQCIDNMVSEYLRLQPEGVIMVTPNNIMGQMSDKYAILDYYLPVDQVNSISDHPNFSCFLIGKDFFEQVGTFDENYNPAWYEDNDMHYRIHLAGKRAITSTACPSVHIGGATTARLATSDSSLSMQHYLAKWGSCNRNLTETFKTPYNDPNKTYKEW